MEFAREVVVSPAGKQGQGENFNLVIREVPHKSSVTVFLLRRGRKTAGGAVTGAAERQKRNEGEKEMEKIKQQNGRNRRETTKRDLQ